MKLFGFLRITFERHSPEKGVFSFFAEFRNIVNEINNLPVTDDIHILTTSETHLDNTFDDTVVEIQGYNFYRKDRNANGGGVAVYIQNHIPVKIREDLISNTVEVIWPQVHLPHLKPILMESCYRPSA